MLHACMQAAAASDAAKHVMAAAAQSKFMWVLIPGVSPSCYKNRQWLAHAPCHSGSQFLQPEPSVPHVLLGSACAVGTHAECTGTGILVRIWAATSWWHLQQQPNGRLPA